MNKVAIAVAAVLTSGSGLITSAQAEMYIGGKVGATSFDDACYSSSPCDDDAFGAGLHTGYDFNKILGLEFGVDYLGGYEANFKPKANQKNSIDDDLWALTLAPKLNWHLNETWNLFAKLGGAYMMSDDEKDFVPTGSLGAEYSVNRNWSIRAEYQRYQNLSDNVWDNMDANFFGIGVNYKFAAPAAPVIAAIVVEEMVVEQEPVLVMKMHKQEYGSGTFEFDSAKLTSAVSERLDNFVGFLKQYPQAQVNITGYTDSSGSAEYNQKLSERRANAVADYLTTAGIDPNRLTVKGMGEENPIADNSTPEGREKNRRIEVVVPRFEYQEIVQPQ